MTRSLLITLTRTQASRFGPARRTGPCVPVLRVRTESSAPLFGAFPPGPEHVEADRADRAARGWRLAPRSEGGGRPGLLLFVVAGPSSSPPGSGTRYPRLVHTFPAGFHADILPVVGRVLEQPRNAWFSFPSRSGIDSYFNFSNPTPHVVAVKSPNMVPEARFSCSWCVLVVLFLHAVRGSFPRGGSAGSPDCGLGKPGDCPGEPPPPSSGGQGSPRHLWSVP